MEVTSKQVIEALNVIERYKAQQLEIIKSLETKNDNRSLDILNLGTRERNALYFAEIKTVGELLSFDRRELMKVRNTGRKTIININKALVDAGIQTEAFRIKY